jgi:hypothetical protein
MEKERENRKKYKKINLSFSGRAKMNQSRI